MLESDALRELHDIHLPPPIPSWSITPGYIALSLLALLFFAVLYGQHRHRKTRQAKKSALQQLTRIEQTYQKNLDTAQATADISQLLKQIALLYYPRKHVAALKGDDWLLFLTQTSSYRKIGPQQLRYALLEAPFRPQNKQPQQPIEPLFVFAKAWIKERRKPCLH